MAKRPEMLGDCYEKLKPLQACTVFNARSIYWSLGVLSALLCFIARQIEAMQQMHGMVGLRARVAELAKDPTARTVAIGVRGCFKSCMWS
jgi:hypothetical protein